MPLNLYNTLTKRHEPFVPIDPNHVTFYSCGPTVYDDAHIGNFRSFLAADVLRRFVESPLCELTKSDGTIHKSESGRKVTHVMNITDVGHMTDDAEGGEHGEDRMSIAGKRLEEAKKSGKLPADVKVDPGDPYQVARFYEGRFKEDAKKLGLKLAIEADADATLMPRATENIAGMIAVIARLIQRGHAYVTGAPGARVVYFDVKSFAPYGLLSGNTLDNLKEGEGGRVSAGNQATKKHPADFLLWKEDASHVMKWDSPWGKGYPGWHIECTAMSVSRLLNGSADFSKLLLPNGNPLIDLHSGGEDNIFPHHECEIAQSCCAFNAEPGKGSFASMWFHPRFLLVEGTKMSKSKGNFYTARDLMPGGRIEGSFEAAAIRLELIKTHYRSNADFSLIGLRAGANHIERWRKIARQVIFAVSQPWIPAEAQQTTLQVAVGRFTDALHDDLKMSTAVTAFQRLMSSDCVASTALDAACRALELPVPTGRESHDEIEIMQRSFREQIDILSIPKEPWESDRAWSAYQRGLRDNTLEAALGALHLIDGILGVIFVPSSNEIPPEVLELREKRKVARAAKDFKTSDIIRDKLASMGYPEQDGKAR